MLSLTSGTRLGPFGILGESHIKNADVPIRKSKQKSLVSKLIFMTNKDDLRTSGETSTSLDVCVQYARKTHSPYY